MPLSSRAPRTAGGRFASKSEHDVESPMRHHQSHHHNQHQRTIQSSREIASSRAVVPDSDELDEDFFDNHDGRPPQKKRKLSIRTHKQTTLHHHFAPTVTHHSPKPIALHSSSPKPPTKVALTEPHGQLVETINGVRTPLNVDEDELAGRSPGAESTHSRMLSRPRDTGAKPASKPRDKVKKEERRSLRSHDEGPRFKTELATYFPNYEEVMFDAPKEEEFVTVDTALYIPDDTSKQHYTGSSSATASPGKPTGTPSRPLHGPTNGTIPPITPPRRSSKEYNGCSPIDLDMLTRNIPDNPDDPLSDEYFLKSHRRAERKEKQLRNIEKERAMHEKVQLERLLDGLQGHDWLKVLGLTGITDGEAKKFEPKRDYFISEVLALVDKFKQWKEQEKIQRLRKEAAAARELESADEETEEGSVEPPSSELAASASQQLQQETINAARKSGFKIRLSKGKATSSNPASGEHTPATHTPVAPRPAAMLSPPSPELPISSFYKKRHLRDAALGKARHGRSVTAFGLPVPELEEKEFELPEGYMNEDVLRANARERRRRKRGAIADAATS